MSCVICIGPGRPAHNAHPQTCSGDPIPPDEVVKRERDKKEKKLRKQLERQVKRLQQSKVKPGVNTATLTEAIHQTLSELRAINFNKEAKDLVGNQLYQLLTDTLNIDVINILRKVVPSQHQLQRYSTSRLTSSQTKSSAFSIENLLSGRGHTGGVHSDASVGNSAVTQPIGFLVNTSLYDSNDSDDSNSDSDSDVESEYMSPNHDWVSSPELDVTDEPDPQPNDFSSANAVKDVREETTKAQIKSEDLLVNTGSDVLNDVNT